VNPPSAISSQLSTFSQQTELFGETQSVTRDLVISG